MSTDSQQSCRPWIFPPRTFGYVLALLLVYFVTAGWLGIEILGPSASRRSAVFNRIFEAVILWTIIWHVVGWTCYFRKLRPPRNARIWPLLIIPLAVCLCGTSVQLWAVYEDHLDLVTGRNRPFSFWLDYGMGLSMAASPLFLWAACCAVLVPSTFIWRRDRTPGRCPGCNYDLTGNTSGVCPECGERIVDDPDVPRYYFRKRFYWLPELARFPDAKSRNEAALRAWDEAKRRSWIRILYAVSVSCIFVMAYAASNDWPETWYLIGATGVLTLAHALAHRRAGRVWLRRELERANSDHG